MTLEDIYLKHQLRFKPPSQVVLTLRLGSYKGGRTFGATVDRPGDGIAGKLGAVGADSFHELMVAADAMLTVVTHCEGRAAP